MCYLLSHAVTIEILDEEHTSLQTRMICTFYRVMINQAIVIQMYCLLFSAFII